jgi:hypothetical protein
MDQRRAFFGAPGEDDPLIGPHDGGGTFTIPHQPIRRRMRDMPRFVVNRGGEYCFMPGLRALRWIGSPAPRRSATRSRGRPATWASGSSGGSRWSSAGSR